VEHHTAIPILHFSEATFRLACLYLEKGEWTEQKNLILMSKRVLGGLAPRGMRARIGYTGLRLGPFSSNLFLLLDRGGDE
jgi:hypothetical protein